MLDHRPHTTRETHVSIFVMRDPGTTRTQYIAFACKPEQSTQCQAWMASKGAEVIPWADFAGDRHGVPVFAYNESRGV